MLSLLPLPPPFVVASRSDWCWRRPVAGSDRRKYRWVFADAAVAIRQYRHHEPTDWYHPVGGFSHSRHRQHRHCCCWLLIRPTRTRKRMAVDWVGRIRKRWDSSRMRLAYNCRPTDCSTQYFIRHSPRTVVVSHKYLTSRHKSTHPSV